jgi:hypothetical protein
MPRSHHRSFGPFYGASLLIQPRIGFAGRSSSLHRDSIGVVRIERYLTFDKIEGWEWIHPAPPRYYLSKSSTGTWAVVDRSSDRAITPDYQTKAAAMRAFFRRFSK